MPYIIAGLGNPGEEYENTRHNTGRIILEAIRKEYGDEFGQRCLLGRRLIQRGVRFAEIGFNLFQ